MIINKKDFTQNTVIDLTGPFGNAFSLMGQATTFFRKFGRSKDDIKKLQDEMTSGNYEHLLVVFEREFGNFVTLLR